MKILIQATAIYPMIGGYEAIAETVAKGLFARGHQVIVVTQANAPEEDDESDESRFPFPVLRSPIFFEWVKALQWADVCLSFNVSLKGLLPWLIQRKPLVVSHQGWYSDYNKPKTLIARIKLLACRLAHNIACSNAVAEYLQIQTIVIPNAYDESLFKERSEIKRDRDILFVGRLVSDKGPRLLLEAASLILAKGLHPSITITGSGPEADALKSQTQKLGLSAQVSFTGPKRGEELALLMNRHRLLVVPSIWAEPFGIVALEGIASGCIVIGSKQGGLCDAIGECGLLFSNGNVTELAQAINVALSKEPKATGIDAVSQDHLRRHQSAYVTRAYELALSGL